ncbi:MAG TPA: hypothetical protein VIV11_17250 [Kofleriaceae bacterium]
MRGVVIAILLAGCGGGEPPANVDAHPGGPLCSKQLYDHCIEEHDCESGICQPFGAFTVCTTACTPTGTACPDDKSGAPAACDNNACKPSAPNMCHLPGQ